YILLDAHGQFFVHVTGSQFPVPALSYADVLDAPDEEVANVFENKAVLVGAFATGTYYHYPTPVSKSSPGVLFHANVIDNPIRMNSMRYLGLRWTFLLIGIFGLVCGLFFARLSAWVGVVTMVDLAGTYWSVAQWLFTR